MRRCNMPARSEGARRRGSFTNQYMAFVEAAAPLAGYDCHHPLVYFAVLSPLYRRLEQRGLITLATDMRGRHLRWIVGPRSRAAYSGFDTMCAGLITCSTRVH